MNPLRNFEFDPTLPLQTKRGAQQALRSGHNTIDDLIRAGLLEVIYIGRIPKITTDSIMRVAASGTKSLKRAITNKPSVLA